MKCYATKKKNKVHSTAWPNTIDMGLSKRSQTRTDAVRGHLQGVRALANSSVLVDIRGKVTFMSRVERGRRQWSLLLCWKCFIVWLLHGHIYL